MNCLIHILLLEPVTCIHLFYATQQQQNTSRAPLSTHFGITRVTNLPPLALPLQASLACFTIPNLLPLSILRMLKLFFLPVLLSLFSTYPAFFLSKEALKSLNLPQPRLIITYLHKITRICKKKLHLHTQTRTIKCSILRSEARPIVFLSISPNIALIFLPSTVEPWWVIKPNLGLLFL